jgi:hypothetical protein
MTCLLICAWISVFIMMIRAVINKDILWPQKQEDRAEGGWQIHPDEKAACDPGRCSTDVTPPLPMNVVVPADDAAADQSETHGDREKSLEDVEKVGRPAGSGNDAPGGQSPEQMV